MIPLETRPVARVCKYQSSRALAYVRHTPPQELVRMYPSNASPLSSRGVGSVSCLMNGRRFVFGVGSVGYVFFVSIFFLVYFASDF